MNTEICWQEFVAEKLKLFPAFIFMPRIFLPALSAF